MHFSALEQPIPAAYYDLTYFIARNQTSRVISICYREDTYVIGIFRYKTYLSTNRRHFE